MAWKSAILGAIFALVATIVTSLLFGFPMWLSLLLYPVLAICISSFILASLLLISLSLAKNGPKAQLDG